MSAPPDSGPFTAHEAAALLGVHEHTIRRAIVRGELAATKRAGSYRISLMDLQAYRAEDTAGRSPTSDAPDLIPRPAPDALPAGDRRATLPHPLTSLVGREREIAEACDILDRGDARLLTLTGPGGVGKTRLAIAIATRLEPDFAHGVQFVRLAAIRSPELVGPAIAQALGVRAAGGRSAAEILPETLRDQHLLLVLDNLEQVVGAAPWLGGLLAACPRLTVLATSRAPLRISGEQRLPVPPLDVPAEQEPFTSSRADAYSAVRLFVQRAKAVSPGFALTDATAAAVAAICRQLDGVPLALELAAARLGAMDIDTLGAQLEQRLPLLTGGPRDLEARLRTMRDAIAWSYDLLLPDEQRLWRRLSVFLGGFTLDAAQAIGAALGHRPDEVVDTVTSLVDQSLLRPIPGTGHYSMLETIHEFGLEQLALAGEEVAARDVHAAWVCEMVATAERGLRGASQVVWLDRLDAERANIRAALDWLAETGRIGQALETAASLWFFWLVRGRLQEGEQLEHLLARPEAAPRAIGRARALNTAAIMASVRGEPDRAVMLHEEALAIFRELGDRAGMAWALTTMNRPLFAKGRFDEALAAAEGGLALFRELRDRWHELRAMRVLGVCWQYRGEWERSKACLRESRAGGVALGDRWLVARAAADLASTFRTAAGEPTPSEVEPLLVESLRLMRELNDTYDLPDLLGGLGELQWARGKIDEAKENFDEALAVARQTGDRTAVIWSLMHLGRFMQRRGDASLAAHTLGEGLRLSIDIGHFPYVPSMLNALATIAATARQPAQAVLLLAAIDGIVSEHHEYRVNLDVANYEQTIYRTKEMLGESAFRHAWVAGRGLAFDDLVAEVARLSSSIVAMPRSAHGLSVREVEILRRMADGRSNRLIADELFISVRTVTTHVTRILNKLGVDSRTAAVAFAIRAGIA